jgi:arylformamidase
MQQADEAADGERRYNARLAVPHYQQIFDRWAHVSAICRKNLKGRLDLRYGPSSMETLDLFLPSGSARGTLMYVHGGYWRSLDKSDASLVAPAFVEAGYAVAVVNYALCPSVAISEIVKQIRSAANWVHQHSAEWGTQRVFVGGHSAGAHLCAMLMSARDRNEGSSTIAGAICVSGLYDLRPLLSVPSVVESTRLTEDAAIELSPALRAPRAGASVLTAIGANESAGFHEQLRVLQDRWSTAIAGHIDCAGHDHFSILDELFDASGSICRAALAYMEAASARLAP